MERSESCGVSLVRPGSNRCSGVDELVFPRVMPANKPISRDGEVCECPFAVGAGAGDVWVEVPFEHAGRNAAPMGRRRVVPIASAYSMVCHPGLLRKLGAVVVPAQERRSAGRIEHWFEPLDKDCGGPIFADGPDWIVADDDEKIGGACCKGSIDPVPPATHTCNAG